MPLASDPKPLRLAEPAPTELSEDIEHREWIESLEAVIKIEGPERAAYLLKELQNYAQKMGIDLPVNVQRPYVNTIPKERQSRFPGNLELERRICSLVRWNAMAMVIRANREESGIGGHISTFASCATLYEVGYNHFFRGRDHVNGGDHIYFQGHASPGNYARAFVEGRLSERRLENFRREIRSREGLSSYPHPWLMPGFWEFPTVSMGLGPIQAIYRARFMRYLENRGLIKPSDAKVWAFVGDGECDEPETLGAISLAPREKLDNLIWVVNCNLQRLDGPVRGNGNIIQELETIFRGVGWNVIKVIWGSEWDELFARDTDGLLVERLSGIIDGEYQKFYVEGGAFIRRHLFGVDPRLEALVADLSDEELSRLRVGGHDPEKVYAAYRAAVEHKDGPTVILAKTIKGYGLGEAGEGRNITHQQKKMNELELRYFRDRFDIPISDQDLASVPFYRPQQNSIELQYIKQRRTELGGFVPERRAPRIELGSPDRKIFEEFHQGTHRQLATTMVLVRMLSKLIRDHEIGKRIVPIVPDEARTFGMDSLFREFGIYSSIGQLYEPVDVMNLMYYREARDGQILEEGITEAGAMCSFIAGGTSHSAHRIAMIPFFFFYSMFGFQRIGDLIWAAGDIRARGFLIGATAGKTTLAGEGLQHQDGHSQLLAQPLPNLRAYDPAFAYEIAVIIEDGLHRMYQEQEDVLYYLTVANEPYAHPPMPADSREGIIKGMYRLRESELSPEKPTVRLLGSGAILNESVKAQQILEKTYGVAADVWSVTSYKQLRQDALDAERWNLLHPSEPAKLPYIRQCLGNEPSVCVAASDYMKALPDSMAKWALGPWVSLGTDGFGRSDGRKELRDFFEVDARYIVIAALHGLARHGALAVDVVNRAIEELGINTEKINPMLA